MEPGSYFPLTLGIRRPKAPRLRRAPRGSTRERDYEAWSEGIHRQGHSFTPFPEMQVFSGLKQAVEDGGRLWIVLGEPGSGKTTLFTEWFCRWATELPSPRFLMAVPVLVRLRELKREILELETESLATQLWRAGCESRARLNRRFESVYDPAALNTFTPVWLLDGLDELPPDLLTQNLFERFSNLPGLKAISCRTAHYENVRHLADPYKGREYEILALRPEEQAALLSDVLSGDTLYHELQENRHLRILAGSPLLLRLFATLWEEGGLPPTRSMFYSAAVQRMWYRNTREFPRLNCDRFATVRDDALAALANRLHLNQVLGTYGLLAEVMDSIVHGATQSMAACVDRSGIVKIDAPRESFTFVHLTFHEYFLARSLEPAGLAAALEKYWIEARYEETLALLISNLVNAGEDAAVEAAICEFIEKHTTARSENPKAFREVGRSPLRITLHLLARAGESVVSKGSRLQSELLAAVGVSQERKLAAAGDDRMPVWLWEELRLDADDDVRELAKSTRNASAPIERSVDPSPNRDTPDEVLSREASNPDTPPSRLAFLAESAEERIREMVAGNPNTPVEVLSRLAAADAGTTVRKRVAGNPAAPVRLLGSLLHDCIDARVDLASNPSLPPDLLDRLAADRNPAVRQQVASASAPSPELLAKLVEDPDDLVRRRVAENPRTDEDSLARLATEASVEIRKSVAKHPSTSVKTLFALLYDIDDEVHFNVIRNPSTLLEDL